MRKCLMALGLLGLVCLMGCDFETSDNGDLDGFWHLEQVDTLSLQKSIDYGGQHIFWSIQAELLQLSNLEDNNIIYRLVHDHQQLTLADPCMFDRADGDTLVTNVEVLRPYGVNSLSETFRVINLKGRDMVLESPLLRLHFRKY